MDLASEIRDVDLRLLIAGILPLALTNITEKSFKILPHCMNTAFSGDLNWSLTYQWIPSVFLFIT